MPSRREPIWDIDRPYHVLTRAVEGREIFGSREDCARLIFYMYAANIGSPALNLRRKDIQKAAEEILVGGKVSEKLVQPEHPPLVEFFSFVLVGNHYHLGLVPTIEQGISRYMQKLNVGFAKYYNAKHNRRGTLFESRFKAIPIKTPLQLDAIVRYINVKNVLDMHQVGWREKGLHDRDSAIKFLQTYPYSSFPDLFLGRNSLLLSPSGRSELGKILKEDFRERKESYLRAFQSYIENETTPFDRLFLE